jgi:lipopolysaccharide export LptBFGC system permease protein LptF
MDTNFKVSIMKKVLLLTSVASFFLCMSGVAQVNTDSLALVSKISEYQLKLGKLQNTINQKTNDKQSDSLHAQQSAQANATAANTLNANPQDKSDARQADNAAGTAKSDARKARKSGGKLDDTNKEILDLQNKIAEEQLKLNKFTRVAYPPMGTTTQPITDSTQHP